MRNRAVLAGWALLVPLPGRSLAAMGASTVLAVSAPVSEAQATPEYALKAEFLLRFTQFVTWPAGAFAAPDAPLVIGVLGSDPFGGQLEAAAAEARTQGRPFRVRRFLTLAELEPCHVLFLPGAEEPGFAAALQKLKGTPTLTVGETSVFARRGGIIGFVIVESRLRFEINASAAEQAGLKVSSQLLRLARVVR